MSKVLYEKRGKIAYVSLNRPEAMNADDPEMHRLLWQLWTEFRDDDGVELAIVTGAGDQAFCAGADHRRDQWLGPGRRAGGREDRDRDLAQRSWAVRSAKETILDVIGRPLDDQLAYEAMTGYSGAANPRVTELLQAFYDKTDEGRPGNDDAGGNDVMARDGRPVSSRDDRTAWGAHDMGGSSTRRWAHRRSWVVRPGAQPWGGRHGATCIHRCPALD